MGRLVKAAPLTTTPSKRYVGLYAEPFPESFKKNVLSREFLRNILGPKASTTIEIVMTASSRRPESDAVANRRGQSRF
jgi:hypothetical protein